MYRPCCFVPTTVCDSTIVAGKTQPLPPSPTSPPSQPSSTSSSPPSVLAKLHHYNFCHFWTITITITIIIITFWLSSPSFSLKTLAITLSAKLPLVELYCRVATEGVRLRGGLFISLYYFIFLLYILSFFYIYTAGLPLRACAGGKGWVVVPWWFWYCSSALQRWRI